MGRMDQNSQTQEFVPDVILQSYTEGPTLLFSLWWGSRHKESLSPSTVAFLLLCDEETYTDDDRRKARMIVEAYPEYCHEGATLQEDVENVVKNIVKTLIDSDLPPLESVTFTFEIDNCTVAFREQLVRGRQSGYWTQTSRTMSLEYMDVNRSKSVDLIGGPEAVKVYNDTVDTVRQAYEKLRDLGVPEEDIRLQPSAQVHRVFWFTNLRVLIKTLKKRSDWIAQGSLWTPIISGILEEISNSYRLYPWFVDLLRTVMCSPAVEVEKGDDGKYHVVSHHYDIENQDRYTGKDPQPVDPLWLSFHGLKMPEHTDMELYEYLKSMYLNLWPDKYLSVLGWRRS